MKKKSIEPLFSKKEKKTKHQTTQEIKITAKTEQKTTLKQNEIQHEKWKTTQSTNTKYTKETKMQHRKKQRQNEKQHKNF